MNSVKQRDYYFDNLKLILITLVVVGHIIEPIINYYYGAKFLYIFIYSFHISLFVFVSGYFSKNFKVTNLIKKVAVPYVSFQILYFLFERYFIGDLNYKVTFLTPYWIMWYLFSLFMWQLILPLFKFKYSIIVAITLSILIGYTNAIGYFLSLSRTVYFFPFFLMGNQFNKDSLFSFVGQKYQKFGSIICIAFICAILYYCSSKIDVRFFYGSYSYAQLNIKMWYAGIYRFLLYGFTTLISICVLYLIPVAKNYFSSIGGKTLNIYLLHGFIIKTLIKYDIYNYLGVGHKVSVLILFGIAITYILSLKIFGYVVSPFSLLKRFKRFKL